MITINGSPFDRSTIVDDYPQNSIEMQLITMMSDSEEVFPYTSLQVLKFDLKLRKEIVTAAIALDKSHLAFAVFEKSRCNPMYWDRTAEGGFVLKDGVLASEAINDIFVNGHQYATECATAMMIVYYKALLEVFGEDKFNKLLPNIYLMDWKLGPLISNVLKVVRVATFLLGDVGYFSNPDVDPKTPEWQGENVVVLPRSYYYGHGIGIATAEEMIRILNRKRKNNATRSAYLMNTVKRLDPEKLFDIYERPAPRFAGLVWRPFPASILN